MNAKKRMMLSMIKKLGTVEKFPYEYTDENGEKQVREYHFQHCGVRKALEIQTNFIEQNGSININLKNTALLENVIFLDGGKKRLTWDHFEEVGMEEADAVFNAASKFLSGK